MMNVTLFQQAGQCSFSGEGKNAVHYDFTKAKFGGGIPSDRTLLVEYQLTYCMYTFTNSQCMIIGIAEKWVGVRHKEHRSKNAAPQTQGKQLILMFQCTKRCPDRMTEKARDANAMFFTVHRDY